MELKGKKVCFLGDSITEGHGTSGKEYTFWSLIGKRTGAEVFGYGIGGSRIAPQRDQNSDHLNDDFVRRADTMIPDADVIVIFGGTNDYGHGDAPFGWMSDREPDTFYGALHTLCRKLMTRYPGAVIVFMTPLHRLEEERLINERGVRNVATLDEYADAIREVAGYYGCPVADTRVISGIQPAVEANCARFIPDGLHPNDAGHILLADRLQAFLEAL